MEFFTEGHMNKGMSKYLVHAHKVGTYYNADRNRMFASFMQNMA